MAAGTFQFALFAVATRLWHSPGVGLQLVTQQQTGNRIGPGTFTNTALAINNQCVGQPRLRQLFLYAVPGFFQPGHIGRNIGALVYQSFASLLA
jgi:hypothetical protein